MTFLDYLLLGGLLAASAYTVYRLFLGWRLSRLNELSDDARERTWQRRGSTTGNRGEI